MKYLELYKNIYDPNILLLHKGDISFDLISIVIETLENNVEDVEDDRKIKKKFNHLVTESFQNLGHHANKDGIPKNSEVMMVTREEDHYSITTGNLMQNESVEELKKTLEDINSKDSDELRALYKEVLSNEKYSDKGTAGLGFIDMARKAGQKLNFEFYQMDEEFTYFTFGLKIVKKQKAAV